MIMYRNLHKFVHKKYLTDSAVFGSTPERVEEFDTRVVMCKKKLFHKVCLCQILPLYKRQNLKKVLKMSPNLAFHEIY